MRPAEQIVERLMDREPDEEGPTGLNGFIQFAESLGFGVDVDDDRQPGKIIVYGSASDVIDPENVRRFTKTLRWAASTLGIAENISQIVVRADGFIVVFDTALGESIAVDLDGTLAKDSGWKGPEHIGEPVKPMLDLVKKLLDDGEEVVIFTARVHDGEKSTKEHIAQWLKDHDLPALEITNEKRPDMEKFYDDKAVAVEKNKGVSESDEFETFIVSDCRVKGQPGNGLFVIYEFASREPGKGNASKALAEVKKRFGYVAVTDIGYPGDPSYLFWRHMLEKGLVDEVNDDQGVQHTVASTMSDETELPPA